MCHKCFSSRSYQRLIVHFMFLSLFSAIPENLKSQTLQGIVLYIDKFLKSDDPNFIHIALWTLIQLLKGKHCCNFFTSGKHIRAICTPLKPHFYIAKLGYAGIYLFFLFLLQNIDCGYSLEPPRRGGSNVYMYPQSMF